MKSFEDFHAKTQRQGERKDEEISHRGTEDTKATEVFRE